MGIHAASLGGTWQALIHGFAGARIKRGILSFNPVLPPHWKSIKFLISYRGFDISVSIYKERVELCLNSSSDSDQLPVRVYGRIQTLRANKKSTFYKRHRKETVYDTKDFY
jgi:trehalose/maltose hydrolase-like predicted phosphorylase